MSAAVDSKEAIALKEKVDAQGLKVRDLKTQGAEKTAIDEAVKCLLQLKADYKTLTGVDLAPGGSSKKDKKGKKSEPSKSEPAQAEKKLTKKEQRIAERRAGTSQPAAAAKPGTAQSAPSVAPIPAAQPVPQDKDMSMPAVLARLASRATQADQLIAHLRTQLKAVRQTAALSASKAEEEKLKSENETLKRQIQDLKNRLVQAEINNGVKQVSMPKRDNTVPSAPVAEKNVAPPKAESAAPAPKSEQPAKKQEKKAKKDGEKKAAAPKANAADSKVVDVSRLDMRIGEIVAVKQHPDADTLYVEEVDLGEEQPRTIVSGLVKHVPIEQMQNRIAIFMCNLKPAKMRGVFSQGMIMCGSTPEKVEIIVPPAGVKKGDRVFVEGYEGTPDEQLNPKKKIFEQVQPDLRINAEGVAVYKGVPWRFNGIEGLCTVPTMKDTPIK